MKNDLYSTEVQASTLSLEELEAIDGGTGAEQIRRLTPLSGGIGGPLNPHGGRSGQARSSNTSSGSSFGFGW